MHSCMCARSCTCALEAAQGYKTRPLDHHHSTQEQGRMQGRQVPGHQGKGRAAGFQGAGALGSQRAIHAQRIEATCLLCNTA